MNYILSKTGCFSNYVYVLFGFILLQVFIYRDVNLKISPPDIMGSKVLITFNIFSLTSAQHMP
jgi:hypothetical protein